MSVESLAIFMDGGSVIASLVCALAMLRLSRRTAERLYSAFALAFLLFAVSAVMIVVFPGHDEHSVFVFTPRLLGFCTIVAGVVDRNRRAFRAAREDAAARPRTNPLTSS